MRVDDVSERIGQAIGIDQFLRIADQQFDPFDLDSIWAMREPLAALALNQEWIFSGIAQRLRERLESPWAREQPSYYPLHIAKNFALRANIWLPEKYKTRTAVLENAAFSYDYPHDHNFDILTVTCFGNGYQTDVYEYDHLPSDISVGSVIDVENYCRRSLSPGSVFLYEACRDVHTQLPVDTPTVTLNFLPFRKIDHARPQFIFEHVDENSLKVVGIPLSPEGREMSAVRMLAKLTSTGAIARSGLMAIAQQSNNSRVADYARSKISDVASGSSLVHNVLLDEIDRDNVAFKYHEVAQISRSNRLT